MPWKFGLYKERRTGIFGSERRLERMSTLDVALRALRLARSEADAGPDDRRPDPGRKPVSAWIVVITFIGALVAMFVHYESPRHGSISRSQQEANQRRIRAEDQARAAEKARIEARQSEHLDNVTRLSDQVEAKWRADIEAAGVTGGLGVVPPMLAVEEHTQYVIVTNKLTDRAVCVQLQRVSRRSQKGNDYDRCRLDLDTCRELPPGASLRFQQYRTGNPPDCANTPLEYRVGGPFAPEPTWWTSTALEDFDARPPPEPLRRDSSASWPLHGNEQQLRDLLTETDRAVRWRREFGPKVDTRKVEKG